MAIVQPVVEHSDVGQSTTRPRRQSRPANWLHSTFAQILIGCGLLWAALPPLNLFPLAWLAPISWTMLARRATLPGKRPYVSIWLAGFCFWLASLYWLTKPHWATSFGWVALSAYLACYFPAFIGLLRVAIHRLHISPIVAAPVAWTGLELVRAHLLGGFLMAALGHTQYRWITLIQVSDLGGAFVVSFLVMWVAACLAQMISSGVRRAALLPVTAMLAAIGAALAYGAWRTSNEAVRPGPKIALVQGSIDIEFVDPQEYEERNQQILDQYWDLSKKAVTANPDLDLIVWPESMCPYPWFTFDKDFHLPDSVGRTTDEIERNVSRVPVKQLAASLDRPMLVGIAAVHHTADKIEAYNSALLVDRRGEPLARYDKCHPVMFGEYIPLADYLPWLYRVTPLTGGLTVGAGPVAMQIGPTRLAANICYESTLSHLIRGQINALRDRGAEPDVLVNLTNDGWFWGSSELDMHLACGVFRAIECRKPFLISANTGFSAWIDADGKIIDRGPRRDTAVLLANTTLDSRGSWYRDHGDWPAGLCLLACFGLAAIGGVTAFGERRAKFPG